ncbi:hypothetical protein QQF64_021138 [Cirrhinus molitorella]|uniref:Uncharacterized protein n=1 Tax=Cirrhinus molitorella TaxID=172907 RepID=A0ABR3LB99_9TELE
MRCAHGRNSPIRHLLSGFSEGDSWKVAEKPGSNVTVSQSVEGKHLVFKMPVISKRRDELCLGPRPTVLIYIVSVECGGMWLVPGDVLPSGQPSSLNCQSGFTGVDQSQGPSALNILFLTSPSPSLLFVL